MESGTPQNHRAHVTEHLSPPNPSPDEHRKAGRRTALPILALFIILLLGSAAVLFLLPISESEPPSRSQQTLPQQPAARHEPEMVIPDESKNSARNDAVTSREQALSLKITADSQNIAAWGGDTYHSLHDAFTRADEHFAQQDFSAAAEQYRRVSADLQKLLDSKVQRLSEALEAGRLALSAEHPVEAREQFGNALAIDPASREAQAGLEQAEQLASLLSLFQRALSLEEAGELEEAVGELEKALLLDDSNEPALLARARIQARIDSHTFQASMNELLSAIENQDFDSAHKSLQSLYLLKINQKQVEQAERLLAEKEKQAFINSSREHAETYRKNEQWQQALDLYTRILSTAPDALFAVAGREEAGKRLKLDTSLTDAIGKPHRLQDERQQEMAQQLLAYAQQIKPQGPKLQSQIAALDTLLKKAALPVTVTLESDNQTDIAIYHVGRIGMFFSTQISLKPGTYTVVGSKIGYRDVRRTITIGSDGGDYRLVIKCEEPI